MKTIWLNNIFRVYPMVMISGGVSNDVIADPRTVQNRTKKQNLASGVYVGKYRAPCAPSIFLTNALENHKEIPPKGGVIANIFLSRREINAEEISPPTGK